MTLMIAHAQHAIKIREVQLLVNNTATPEREKGELQLVNPAVLPHTNSKTLNTSHTTYMECNKNTHICYSCTLQLYESLSHGGHVNSYCEEGLQGIVAPLSTELGEKSKVCTGKEHSFS